RIENLENGSRPPQASPDVVDSRFLHSHSVFAIRTSGQRSANQSKCSYPFASSGSPFNRTPFSSLILPIAYTGRPRRALSSDSRSDELKSSEYSSPPWRTHS